MNTFYLLPASNKNSIKGLLLALLIITSCGVKSWGQPPAGYYQGTTTLSGAPLKTALHHIIINKHKVVTYDDLWTHMQWTDAKTTGKVWDIYSEGNPTYEYTFVINQCSSTPSGEGVCYNREHAFPQSWFGEDKAAIYSDIFHLYPVDGYINGMRSNHPYGEVAVPLKTSTNGSKRGANSFPGYTGTVFEPIDEFKGDLARTMFYIATRYEDRIAGWEGNSIAGVLLNGTSYPVFENWYLDMLLKWHQQDPVSQKERDRNNAAYEIQGNRNPFIDNPDYVLAIWGEPDTGPVEAPLAHVTNFSASTITLNWTDATGALLPHGYLIRMSTEGFSQIAAPTTGMEVADDFYNRNAGYGQQTTTFGGLTQGTLYYFKIFSYTGSGTSIKYKTNGEVPQTSIIAQ